MPEANDLTVGIVARSLIPKFVIAVDLLGVNVTTAFAGALGKIVTYEADEQERPTGRITEIGDLDFSAVGAKEATGAIPFKKGKQYWIGIRHSSTAVILAWQAYTSPDFDLTAIATSPNKTLQRTLAHGTAAPASWGYVPTEAAVTLAIAIWMWVG